MYNQNLIKMINDISNFFCSDPDPASAMHGVVDHLREFWDPRMRKAIVLHHRAGGEGLSELARRAVQHLAQEYVALSEVGDG